MKTQPKSLFYVFVHVCALSHLLNNQPIAAFGFNTQLCCININDFQGIFNINRSSLLAALTFAAFPHNLILETVIWLALPCKSKTLNSFHCEQFIVILFSRMVNAAVYYGVSFSSVTLGGNMYLNFFIGAVVEIPANIIALSLLNR